MEEQALMTAHRIFKRPEVCHAALFDPTPDLLYIVARCRDPLRNQPTWMIGETTLDELAHLGRDGVDIKAGQRLRLSAS